MQPFRLDLVKLLHHLQGVLKIIVFSMEMDVSALRNLVPVLNRVNMSICRCPTVLSQLFTAPNHSKIPYARPFLLLFLSRGCCKESAIYCWLPRHPAVDNFSPFLFGPG